MHKTLIALLASIALTLTAAAQVSNLPSFPDLPGQTVVGNSSPVPAPAESITFAQLSAALATLNPVAQTTFPISKYGAVCDGVTDDTAAIQSAITAWKAASTTTNSGIAVLVGMGNGRKCKTTSPLDFTRVNQSGPLGSVVRDFYDYASFKSSAMLLPIGTLTITSAGSGGTPGTYSAVSLTNVISSGSGCKVNVTVGGSGAVTQVQSTLTGVQGGCGLGYRYGDTFSVTAGGVTASLDVATLSGGAAIDAMASKFIQWQNVIVEGDCTNLPNVGFAWGRAQQNAQADSHSWFSPATYGCFLFAPAYNLASEVNAYFHAMFGNTLANTQTFNGQTITNCYVYVGDGSNHFNWSTIGAGVTWSTPVDVSESYTENQFFNARLTIPSDTSCPSTVWLSNPKHMRFFGSYMLSQNKGAVLWSQDSTSVPEDLQFDVRFENGTNLTNCFVLAGNYATPLLSQFYYDDDTSNCNAGGSPSVFQADQAGAFGGVPITSVTMQGLTVKIARFASGTPTLFDTPSIYTVGANFIQLPGTANWNQPANFTGGTLCLGNTCAPIVMYCASSVQSPTTSATEVNLASCVLPPLLANSCVRVETGWSMTGSTNSKTFRVRYNSGTTSGITGALYLSTSTTTNTNVAAHFETMFCNVNSTSSQKGYGTANGVTGLSTAAAITSSVASASPSIINITGFVASGDSVNLENYAVEVFQHP